MLDVQRRNGQQDFQDVNYAPHLASMSLALSNPFCPPIQGFPLSRSFLNEQTIVPGDHNSHTASSSCQADTVGSPEQRSVVISATNTRHALFARETQGQCREEILQKELLPAGIAAPQKAVEKQLTGKVTVSAAGGGEASRGTVRSFVSGLLKGHMRVVPYAWLGLCLFAGFSRRSKKSARAEGKADGTGIDDFGSSISSRDRQRRVLILMSDTGGGHRASAEAIKQAIFEEFGDNYKVTVIDLWKEHTPWPFNQMPKSYSFLVKHETLWKVAFHVTKPRFVHQPQMAATSAFVAREVAKGLNKYQPDVIVSVHPLMQHIPIRVLRSKGLLNQIPFTTVITDLTTCHPTWFHKLATVCFCPTKDVAQRAFKAGLKANQIKVHGLPIRPSFCKPVAPKEECRRDLGMDTELPAVLLMGGGEGMGPVEATARALAQSLGGAEPKGQLIVVCGRNKKLLGKLQAIDWPLPVQIKGFVTNMPEWMAACDCIISKAGPGTIAEAMIRGLPMIINDYIAGQEVGNVPFVVDNGAGKFCEVPKEIAKIVAGWFGPKIDELRAMSANALKLARPDAVFRIVHDLDRLARRRDNLPQAELALTS